MLLRVRSLIGFEGVAEVSVEIRSWVEGPRRFDEGA